MIVIFILDILPVVAAKPFQLRNRNRPSQEVLAGGVAGEVKPDKEHRLRSVPGGRTAHVGDAANPYYSRPVANRLPAAAGRRLPRGEFDAWANPRGALFTGSPQEIIEKIIWEQELLGQDRFFAPVSPRDLPFVGTARSIDLLAAGVLPLVRRETAVAPIRLTEVAAGCPPKRRETWVGDNPEPASHPNQSAEAKGRDDGLV